MSQKETRWAVYYKGESVIDTFLAGSYEEARAYLFAKDGFDAEKFHEGYFGDEFCPIDYQVDVYESEVWE